MATSPGRKGLGLSMPEPPPQGSTIEDGVPVVARRPTRRAMIASAVCGLQTFKQSWWSIMVLKGGIGLSQVLTLVILLILASFTVSPGNNRYQSQESTSCPHPELFQAWIGASIGRLVICWSASVWVCVRHRRAAGGADEERQVAGPDQASRPTHFESRSSLVETPPTPPLSHSHSTSTAGSSSSGTLVQLSNMQSESNSDITPSSLYNSRLGRSSEYSLDGMIQYTSGKRPSSTELLDAYELFEGFGRKPRGRMTHPHDNPGEGTRSTSTVSLTLAESTRPAVHPGVPANLQAARDMVAGRENRTGDRSLATTIDQLAPTISKAMGLLSVILFILGNILAFNPFPTSQSTCYHSSPLLWWAVMAVTGVGWFLLLQMFFVIVVVGIGGQAVLALLRSVGVVPPAESAPRKAPPPVLKPEELDALPLFAFVPAGLTPKTPPITSSTTCTPTSSPSKTSWQTPSSTPGCATHISSPMKASRSVSSEGTIDLARLARKPLLLSEDKATCAICQEGYAAPKEARAILLQVDVVRQLPCEHVFHSKCIDQWLLEGFGSCPMCNRPVRPEKRGT